MAVQMVQHLAGLTVANLAVPMVASRAALKAATLAGKRAELTAVRSAVHLVE